ncbi:hypothetical protein TrRE_jg9067 [Triparma retinervis]|uniref:Uncharacterized protein n=1 Tax=Triparma retinervis TaxID=2557542 RepID=A0A9W6ZEH4_9STRA|nr:hypothetical protein TrRE_jg9067 [Triparma retinervis]
MKRAFSTVVSNKTRASSLLSKGSSSIFQPIIPQSRTAMKAMSAPTKMNAPSGAAFGAGSSCGKFGDVKVMNVVKKIVR